jgi:hypothetical protein
MSDIIKNLKNLPGLKVRYVGPVIDLKHGKYKREIHADMGKQRYLLDEIKADPVDFLRLKSGDEIDTKVYINGITKNGSRENRLCIKKYWLTNNQFSTLTKDQNEESI